MQEAKRSEEYCAFYIKDGDIHSEEIQQQRHDIGTRSFICPHCKAMLWEDEPRGMCCAKGKVKLPPMPEPPPVLKRLYEEQSADGRHFRRYINTYNNAFSMTNSGMNHYKPGGRGPPVFFIQGVPYHVHGALKPPPKRLTPKYAQRSCT